MFYLEMSVAFKGEWKRRFLPLMLSVLFDLNLAVNGMEKRKNF